MGQHRLAPDRPKLLRQFAAHTAAGSGGGDEGGDGHDRRLARIRPFL
jgi:hypothetical protein